MAKQKWLSLFLCVAMVLTILPITAWAESNSEGNLPKEPVEYLDEDDNVQTEVCDVITADNISGYTTLTSGWYVVKETEQQTVV